MSFRLLGIITAAFLGSVAAADFVIFMLSPSKGLGVLLEGEVDTRNNAQLLTLRHKKYGEIILPRDQCKWFKAEDPRKKQAAALKAAAKTKDVDTLWRLAKDSIRRGNAGNYFRAAEIILEFDQEHKEAERANRLAALIDAEIPESKEEESKMRKDSKIEKKVQFERSEHFLLMHDLSGSKRGLGKTPRTAERLEVMEKVYKAFLAFFWSRGFELQPPKERLRVVLLEKEQDFKEFAASQDASSVSASGFFNLIDNVSYFYEHRGTPNYREMKSLTKELKDVGKERNVINRGDFVRLGKALDLMTEVWSEQDDIAVCSHEMTHQLAANTKLMPTNRGFPLWVAEGFACYFESPKDAQWSGIGAVNKERLAFYRKARRSNNSYCNVEAVVSDRIFLEARSFEERLNAYSVSWSLTHFLMEKHFDRLMAYYQKIAKLPPFEHRLKPSDSASIFWSCFTGEQKQNLNAHWHAYMQGLKTDLETITDMDLEEVN
jgi:hypothetical protein